MLSIYAQYASTICASCPSFHAHCFAENIHRSSHEWDMEKISFGGGNWSTYRVLAVLREYILRVLAVFRGYVLCILSALPGIPGCGTAGTACTRGSVLLILPVLAVIWSPFLQYSPYSEHTRSMKYTRSICEKVALVALLNEKNKPLDAAAVNTYHTHNVGYISFF